MNSTITKVALTSLIAVVFAQLLMANYLAAASLLFLIFLLLLSVRSPVFFVICVIIIHEELFQTHNFGVPVWWYSDIAIVVLGLGILIQFVKNGWSTGIGRNYYYRAILILLGIVAFSMVWGAWLVNQQPIATLVLRTRLFLFYFIFLYLYQTKFDIKQINAFMKFVIYSSVIVSILVIIDAKLGGNKIFQVAWLNGASGFRAGRARIFVYDFILSWAYFYLLSAIRFEKDKIKRVLYFIFWSIILYQFIFCNMTRQILLMTFLTTTIFLFRLENRSKTFVLWTISLFFIIALIISLNSNLNFKKTLIGKLYSQTQNEMSDKEHGNIAVRVNNIKFYYPYFQKTGFLGMGIMSTTYAGSPVFKGGLRGYTFADIGFFAILFRFGVFAIIFIVLISIRFFRDLMFIQKNNMDISTKILANSLIYLLISKIIFLPSWTIFFREDICLYYGIIFYFVYKMKNLMVKS